MIDRARHMDNCSPVRQVQYSQEMGAAAVVFANDACFSFIQGCRSYAKAFINYNGSDGFRNEMSIPALLIYKEDVGAIKRELENAEKVVVSICFTIPTPSRRVAHDLWTAPADASSTGFFADFVWAASALGDRADFTPHVVVNRCPWGRPVIGATVTPTLRMNS